MKQRLDRYEDLRGSELIAAFSEDIQQWAGPCRRIYWITDEQHINLLKGRLAQPDQLRTVTKIELPEIQAFRPALPRGPAPPTGLDRRRPGIMNPGYGLGLIGEPLLLEWTLERP